MRFRRSIATALLLLLTGCTRFAVLNALVPTTGYTRTTGLIYGPLSRQKLDVYRPTRPLPTHDVVIFFYGGDWQEGSRGDYRFVGQALASHGFVAVLPDYRLYPDVTFPAFLEDGATAVRWTHDAIGSFGGNPRRLFLMGHSAGAYIAVMLTLNPTYLQHVGMSPQMLRGTAGLSGPYDFLPPVYDKAVFGLPTTATAMPAEMEPIHFVNHRSPPILLLQGLKDTTVNPANTAHLAAALSAGGSPVQTALYPHRAHVGVVLALAWPFRWLDPVLSDTATFFKSH